MTAAKGKLGLVQSCTAASRRQRRLDAFDPSCRRFVAELASCAQEIEDLADTFPALLFALVSGYGSPGQREQAFDLICAGASLREAADALGLPWWLRRLPPQAFVAPLAALPCDAEFSLRISNLLPRETRLAAGWLTRVGQALEAAGPEYALWIARQPDLANPPNELFLFMGAWAWFNAKPGTLGHRLLRRPWTPDMSFKRACEELAAWRQRVRLIDCLGPGIESPWLADGQAAGFDFIALRTVDDFISESEALENCLDQYADQLYTGLTAVFSIRKGPRRVACVEIGMHDEEVTMPTIVQLRAARNRRAPPDVWQATFAWLGGQRLSPLSPSLNAPNTGQRIKARQQLWGPYLTFLAGSRHAAAFRRAALAQPRVPQHTHPRHRTRAVPARMALVYRPAEASARERPPAAEPADCLPAAQRR